MFRTFAHGSIEDYSLLTSLRLIDNYGFCQAVKVVYELALFYFRKSLFVIQTISKHTNEDLNHNFHTIFINFVSGVGLLVSVCGISLEELRALGLTALLH